VALCALVLRCEASVGQQPVGQASTVVQGTPGVLVLQDGGVLAGTFSRQGDRYVLTRNGGELQVPASRVLVACPSIEEAYDERRKLLGRPSAEVHLALAEWCLRHNLLPQAAREIVDARGLDPNSRQLALLERRLAAAGSPRPQHGARVGADVKTVAHTEPIERTPSENAIQPAAIAIDDLPPGAIERFTRRVQPILVNNCTASGCHQLGGQQEFQLDRALLHDMANRRSTMQNLAATLALIDREQPHLSRLVTMPRQTHGGMRSPVFGPRHAAAFSHVVEWVALVTNADSSEEQSRALDEHENLEPPVLENSVPGRLAQTASLQTTSEADAASIAPQLNAIRARGAVGREIRFGARLQTWQPDDPFDPEIFHRMQPVAAPE
jgi:hypothetical protein